MQVAIGLFLLFIVVRVGGGRPASPPQVAADCTTPSLRLSAASAPAGAPIAYTFTGPAEAEFVVAIDAVSVRRAEAGRYTGEPAGSVVTRPVRPAGCRATGLLGLPFERGGPHTVRLFRIEPDGTGREVDRVELAVTDR